MYEKKNKLSQPATVLDKISVGYRTLNIVMLMTNAPLFFKAFIFDGCSGKYRLNVPF